MKFSVSTLLLCLFSCFTSLVSYADFVGRKGSTLNPGDVWYNEFTVKTQTLFVLYFASEYGLQAGIFGSSEISNFENGRTASFNLIFDKKYGISSVTLAPGDYAVGVRGASSATQYSLELEEGIPKISGATYEAQGISDVTTISKNGGRRTHEFTIQDGFAYNIEGLNSVGLDYWIIPAAEAGNFRAGGSFNFYEDYQFTSDPNQPGLMEIKLNPGEHALAFRNSSTKDSALVYQMYVHRIDSVDSGTGSGTGTSSGTSSNLDLSCPCGLASSGSQLTIEAASVTNTGGASGPLRLQVWATANKYNGGSIGGYVLGTLSLSSSLGNNRQYSNINETTSYATPPDGSYFVTLTLEEEGSSGYTIKDYSSFSDAWIVGQATSGSGSNTGGTTGGSTGGTTAPDMDGDGISDANDPDDDNDGVLDAADAYPLISLGSLTDTDADGRPNDCNSACLALGMAADTDDDNDGVLDTADAFPLDPSKSVAAVHAPQSMAAAQMLDVPQVGLQLTSAMGERVSVPSIARALVLNVTVVNPTAPGYVTVWPCGGTRPLASSLNYGAGEVVPNGVIATVGANGNACFFSQSGTDLVVDVAGWFEGTAYVGVSPTRLVDTRDGTGGRTGQVDAGSPLTIQVSNLQVNGASGNSVTTAANMGAVALNVTAVTPSAAGYITVWPCDIPRPLSSNINFSAGQVVANGVLAPVSASGTVCLYSQVPTDVVVDMAGWFAQGSFTGTVPQRLADTRDGTGGRLGALTPDTELRIPIHNINLDVNGVSTAVPVTAVAAALNVTVVNPSASGYATVWPCGVARPLASNLNFTTGQVVANNVIAPIGNEGAVCVYANVPTDVIVDVAGWFSDTDTGKFVGTTPQRLVDTREGIGPVPTNE
ncbi:MAG: hypothetical protein ACI9J0_004084 [Cryomorphaceae bacterium]|jgi:hypothetical protein